MFSGQYCHESSHIRMATYQGDVTDRMTPMRTVSLGRWQGLSYKDGRSNAVSAAAAAGGPVITAPQLQPREGHEQQPLDNCAFD